MLFNSYEFLFIFLPAAVFVFYLLGKNGNRSVARSWLLCASLFFYGWWHPGYLWLIAVSILWNYLFSRSIEKNRKHNFPKRLRWVFIACVGGNLLLLAYYKYTNFLIESLCMITDTSYHMRTIILPLAISFFTFQQIAYIFSVFKYGKAEDSFIKYGLFVSFFPQLIAGPIVHHQEMLPQFKNLRFGKLDYGYIATGLTVFIIGLFKKVVLADSIAVYVSPVFNAAAQGKVVYLFDAWGGVLAYTFQLYFDFSGYTDMAIGAALLFGIHLPLNFYSPYKADSIIEFWRRWHVTLSRFLKECLYIPLGGSRRGTVRKYINLLITMTLAGLWHGAGWTFVIWGALHGVYLVINHVWRKIIGEKIMNIYPASLYYSICRVVTFIAIVVAWVVFRAETLDGALVLWKGMLGLNGISGVEFPNGGLVYFKDGKGWFYLLGMLMLVWVAPNTGQMMIKYQTAIEILKGGVKPWRYKWLQWHPSLLWLSGIAVLCVFAIAQLHNVSEFLYFNF